MSLPDFEDGWKSKDDVRRRQYNEELEDCRGVLEQSIYNVIQCVAPGVNVAIYPGIDSKLCSSFSNFLVVVDTQHVGTLEKCRETLNPFGFFIEVISAEGFPLYKSMWI